MRDKDSLLPTTYLTVLTLIGKGARYGYEINDLLERHGYRNWVDLQFSSIYKALNELENRGLVKGVKEDESVKASKKVYSLTRKGSNVVKEQILRILSNPPRCYTMFDLGLSALSSLTRNEVLDALVIYRENLSENITFLSTQVKLLRNIEEIKKDSPTRIIGHQQAVEFDGSDEIEVVVALFERPLRGLESQIIWLDEFIEKVNEGRGFNFKVS
ncbi:MAG: PadR family transcriptional regulator [Candidatus Thorarchaeota archaeon]